MPRKGKTQKFRDQQAWADSNAFEVLAPVDVGQPNEDFIVEEVLEEKLERKLKKRLDAEDVIIEAEGEFAEDFQESLPGRGKPKLPQCRKCDREPSPKPHPKPEPIKCEKDKGCLAEDNAVYIRDLARAAYALSALPSRKSSEVQQCVLLEIIRLLCPDSKIVKRTKDKGSYEVYVEDLNNLQHEIRCRCPNIGDGLADVVRLITGQDPTPSTGTCAAGCAGNDCVGHKIEPCSEKCERGVSQGCCSSLRGCGDGHVKMSKSE